MKSTGMAPETPAAWTKPPRDPSAASASDTATSTAAVSATSITAQWTVTPERWRHRSAVSRAPRASISQMATGRPTSARARAVSRPIPDPPPVTRTPVPGEPSDRPPARVRGSWPSWLWPSWLWPSWLWPSWLWPSWLWPSWLWPSWRGLLGCGLLGCGLLGCGLLGGLLAVEGWTEVPWAQSFRTARLRALPRSGPESRPRLHARVELGPQRIGLVPSRRGPGQ